jgi:hypothetical protein
MPEAELTHRSAIDYARVWVDNASERRSGGQFQALLTDLAALCVSEAIRQGDGEDGLDQHLDGAYAVLYELQNFGFPAKLEKRRWEEAHKVPEVLQGPLKAARASVWKRCDPRRSLQEGFESENYFNGTATQLHEDLSKYLQLRWLRHPSVDWSFLDMMVTRELCPLGEEIKQMLFPGKKDSMGVHHKYWTARGNVSEMAALSGLARLWGPSREFTDPSSPFTKGMQLWEAMYGTWNSLKGPVINPMMVRDKMIKSKDMGAVWPSPSWALIERVIELDRSVWLVGPYSH